MTRCIS